MYLRRISRILVFALIASFIGSGVTHAAIFGIVKGVVEDPQHRPVQQADVALHARLSSWQAQAQTDAEGRYLFTTVPAGDYTISVVKQGFQTVEQRVVVRSGTTTSLTMTLSVGAITETVEVTSSAAVVNPRSATTESLITRNEIERTPGAIRTNSLDVVTQFVPGAYLIHDQLHIRGGHQVSWLIDGVPVPNTNISTTVGPQFDPKDIETIEIERGGYSAEFGDRTYGVFNVIPRSGFERSREAELIGSFGSFHETNDQFSLGNHTDDVAYFASINANRTELGLETPVSESIHNRGEGVGGFGSLIYKMKTADQLRLAANVRGDHFEIPNGREDEEAGIDDHQRERDGFVNLSWLHTIGSSTLLTVSPFYHYNRAMFDGGPTDPVVTTDHRGSHYVGAQAVLAATKGTHSPRIGTYGFFQRDETLFGLRSSGSAPLGQTQSLDGNVIVAFIEDQYAVTDWLTLTGGVRATRFAGAVTERAANPRVGATLRIPRLEWVLRGYYGRYYQPPPLTTVSGPLLDLAVKHGFGFLPLKGERDEQYEIGLAIPVQGWAIDLDHFRTNTRNFFDHDVIGNSNVFIPLTIDTGRIRGWEATIRSPRRANAQAHLAYSHQFIEGRGAVSGGLTAFEPPSDDFFFLDHDQRDTMTGGVEMDVSTDTSVSVTVGYGSGFLERDGPAHKPSHVVLNLQGQKTIGKAWTVMVTGLNVGDTHFLLDESNTFGGTHFNNPRQISVGARYRFHY